MRVRSALPLLAALVLAAPLGAQELRGHGGPVRALAVDPDGAVALSGSFDASAILWGLEGGVALAVLRAHDGAVNAVASVGPGRFATAGEDGRIAFWRVGSREPERLVQAHQGPVAALAASPDRMRLASASWDGTARVETAPGGQVELIQGHRGPVNAVAFAADGASVITGGHDGAIRMTPLAGGSARTVQTGAPVNALVVAANGAIAAAGADATVRFYRADGEFMSDVRVAETPIVALALAPDGKTLAAAAIRGSVALVDWDSRAVRRVLVGPGLPVWSVAFRPDSKELLTGGGDRLVRRWNASTGEHIGAVAMSRPNDLLAEFRGDRGAEVFRACVACHTLDADSGNRAGPTLHRIIGRRIATQKDYEFSSALKNMDIVWTRETIARLFEIGPNAYTPGTKMPEQIVSDPDDRQALVDFIARASAR